MHQGTNGAWDAFWKQAMSRQRKYGWAAYSRPGNQVNRIQSWPGCILTMEVTRSLILEELERYVQWIFPVPIVQLFGYVVCCRSYKVRAISASVLSAHFQQPPHGSTQRPAIWREAGLRSTQSGGTFSIRTCLCAKSYVTPTQTLNFHRRPSGVTSFSGPPTSFHILCIF